ncbi:MAG: hypothetical protein ACYDHP_13390 [Ferrimicrobium sp.]
MGDPGQGDASDFVGSLDEAAAVEADAGGHASPDVGGANLGESPVDSDPAYRPRGDGLGLAVGIGEGENLIDVPGRVVVIEDGLVEVGAVGTQHPGRCVHRVDQVIRAGWVGAAGWWSSRGGRGSRPVVPRAGAAPPVPTTVG